MTLTMPDDWVSETVAFGKSRPLSASWAGDVSRQPFGALSTANTPVWLMRSPDALFTASAPMVAPMRP